MEVIKNHNGGEDPLHHLGFEELSDLGGDCLFFYGGLPHNSVKKSSDKPKIFFSTEEQSWDRDTTDNYISYLDKILTICPPRVTNRAKREYAFFPFNEKYIPENTDKVYDIIYCGNAVLKHVTDSVNVIKDYNYRYVSLRKQPLATDINVTYRQKLDLIAKSKITLVHNLLGNNTPQVKTRMFEAAFSKSLILCLRDDWNIVEDWFEPETEFIYYDPDNLKETIDDILNNYTKYQSIIDAAYDRAINNYTTKQFILKYLK